MGACVVEVLVLMYENMCYTCSYMGSIVLCILHVPLHQHYIIRLVSVLHDAHDAHDDMVICMALRM